MTTATAFTYWVKIFIAGPIEVAKQILRREAMAKGMCVTIEPTLYLNTGGEEAGYVVGFINYPRFPKDSQEILEEAKRIAEVLRTETYQHSYTLMDPYNTVWHSTRDQ